MPKLTQGVYKWLSLDLNLGTWASPTASGLYYELGFGPRAIEITMTKFYTRTCEAAKAVLRAAGSGSFGRQGVRDYQEDTSVLFSFLSRHQGTSPEKVSAKEARMYKQLRAVSRG